MSDAAKKKLHRFNRGEAIFRFGEKYESLYKLVRKQIISGPNLDFSRSRKNQSYIGEADKKLVKTIIGYDTKYYICMQVVEIT